MSNAAVHAGDIANTLAGNQVLFLNQIPLNSGLFGGDDFGNRIRYGVEVSWETADGSQSGTWFINIDSPIRLTMDELRQLAGEDFDDGMTESPKRGDDGQALATNPIDITIIYAERRY